MPVGELHWIATYACGLDRSPKTFMQKHKLLTRARRARDIEDEERDIEG